MNGTPGTVSKILWHFTGGLKWDENAHRQTDELRPPEDGYKALVGILGSRELRVGRLAERIDVETAHADVRGIGPSRQVTFRNLPRPMLFAQACCLADIPIIHLRYHEARYGKTAIGFHRDAVVNAGFSPVLYQLPNSHAAKCLIEALDLLDAVSGFFPVRPEHLRDDPAETDSELSLGSHDEMITKINAGSLKRARECVAEVACYIKTFELHEFDTIYTEREWRSIQPFKFEFLDVPMIVVPREGGYFGRLIADAESLGLPRSLSIVAWEDLVEH
jgi:hypothetical protein